jgi:fructose-specific phosphotransferase system IIC component
MLYLSLFFVISGFTAILILSVFDNRVINSALFPLILFYSLPRLAVYFEQTRVTISEDYKDIAEALYSKYYSIILVGFFAGYAAKLIDNWLSINIIDFYWFIINFFIITMITVLTLRNDIFD